MMNIKIRHNFKIVYACLAAGLGSSAILLLVLMLFIGLNDAFDYIFEYQVPLILALGLLWLPFIKNNLK